MTARWIAAALAALMLSCGSGESRRAADPIPAEPSAPGSDPERAAATDEAGDEAGDEAPAPPAPDARTLADGRALAAPGQGGFLSTVRVWASGEVADEASLGAPCEGDGCPPPRVVAFADHRLDLREAAEGGATTVYVGATLLATAPTRVNLLIGVKGRVAARLDGEVVVEGESADWMREDLLLAPLVLAPGEHRLVVRYDAPERGQWRGSLRFLSAETEAGPGNVAIALGRLDEAEAATLAAAAVRLEELHEPTESGPSVRVTASLPGGAIERPIEVTLAQGDDARTTTLSPEGRLHPGTAELAAPMPERGALRIEARVGERSETFGLAIAPDRRALEAAAILDEALTTAPEGSRAPIAWRRDELLRAVREGDGDARWRSLLTGEARRIRAALARDRDPFGRIRGYERMAFFSAIDGTAQEYELFVPPAYSDRRAWPLVVTLHGYKGNAGDYFRNTFGLARDWENGESLDDHGRHGVAPTSGPMIVIGPTGRGQSFYRHAGETDVLEAIADARARFRIDQRRIYITGGSMGGTGAAYLPFRHPDLFAASVALAGYHDQRVRQDTDHEGLSEVERFLQARRSDVDWAENALHLPMLLVRGTRDRPLEWTRSLAHRLEALGYDYEHREPDLGHNVWTETYAEGALFTYLRRYRRPEQPSHVRLRTARERTRSSYWVTIEQREAPDRFAEVDARLADGVVTATIEGARAVTFAPTLEPGASLTVRIGERTIEGASPLTVERFEGGWRAATHAWPEPDARRAGAAGPIRDVFHDPLTFVVGTQDPRHTLINRLVAETWAHPHGWIVDYPIVDDVDVTDAMIASRSLVLIGPPASNAVHARYADRLPIQVTADGVRFAGETHRGAQVGTTFVAPNPDHPTRSLLVIAGPRPLGTWRANDLPDILPDYVIYDERVAPAHARWACGGTGCEYLSHGFFTE